MSLAIIRKGYSVSSFIPMAFYFFNFIFCSCHTCWTWHSLRHALGTHNIFGSSDAHRAVCSYTGADIVGGRRARWVLLPLLLQDGNEADYSTYLPDSPVSIYISLTNGPFTFRERVLVLSFTIFLLCLVSHWWSWVSVLVLLALTRVLNSRSKNSTCLVFAVSSAHRKVSD